jgi:hypothetical protein
VAVMLVDSPNHRSFSPSRPATAVSHSHVRRGSRSFLRDLLPSTARSPRSPSPTPSAELS